jgi:hypothetical protein
MIQDFYDENGKNGKIKVGHRVGHRVGHGLGPGFVATLSYMRSSPQSPLGEKCKKTTMLCYTRIRCQITSIARLI